MACSKECLCIDSNALTIAYPFYDEDGDFIPENALIALIADGVIFLNSYHWKQDWPNDAKEVISLNVFCSDTFGYACADSEEIFYKDLQTLAELWQKDPVFGAIAWVTIRRQMKPLAPIIEEMEARGFMMKDLIHD